MVEIPTKWLIVGTDDDAMLLFTGNHARTLDEKNRIQIPAEFRAEFAREHRATEDIVLFVAPGPRSNILSIYSRTGLDNLVQRIAAQPADSPDAIDLEYFFPLVERAEMDKQGRMVMPQSLLSYRNLGKELTLAGQVDRIDVWKTEEFVEQVKGGFEKQLPSYAKILKRPGAGVVQR